MSDIISEMRELPGLARKPFYYQVKGIVERASCEIERLRGGIKDDYRFFDKDRAIILVGSEVRLLSRYEFLLLERLVQFPGKVVTRRQCLDAIYANEPDGGPEGALSVLKSCVHYLRKKSPWPIRNIYGLGYLIEGYQGEPKTPHEANVVCGVSRDRLMAGR